MSERLLNLTAVKAHALKVSKETRAGKFERVSEEFLNQVVADVETIVRELNAKSAIADGFATVQPEGTFATGELLDKIRDNLDPLIGRIIQRRVHRHPSVGKTLMG